MKRLLLTALFFVFASTQTAFAQENWQAENARPLIDSACEIQKVAQNIIAESRPLLSCTTETTQAFAGDAFDIADDLAASSLALFKFRLKHQENFSQSTLHKLIDLENQIESIVGQFRARGIATVLYK